MRRSWLRVAGTLGLVVFLGCSPDISRSKWQSLSPEDRVLYVQTLLGAEKSKEAKGGSAKRYPRPAEEYVAKIEAAYARGDVRDVPAIFAELGTK